MKRSEEEILTLVGEEDSFKMQIVKKRVPLKVGFLKGEEARRYVVSTNELIYFYKNFETRIAIKRGDVFVARFVFECGNELHGDHFVAALLDSSPLNPVVTVVPLKSAKGRPLNPASDILLGNIEGIENGKESVAIINQIRTIDKRRLFDTEVLKHLERYLSNEMLGEHSLITCQFKKIYRLSDGQYRKMHKAVEEYICNGYIKHN